MLIICFNWFLFYRLQQFSAKPVIYSQSLDTVYTDMYLGSTPGFPGQTLSAKESLKKQIKCLNLEYWINKLPTKVLQIKFPRPTPSNSLRGEKKRNSRKEKKWGWAISPFIIFGGRFLLRQLETAIWRHLNRHAIQCHFECWW